MAEELGVTKAALTSFFKILEQKSVPPEDLDSKLREIAQSYKELRAQLQTFTADDPTVVTLQQAVDKALEAGDFPRAEALLQEARAKDIQAAQQLRETATKRQRSAAATTAVLGALKMTQVAYAEAASYYRQAAELVSEASGEMLATYLNMWGLASYEAGDYAGAASPWQRALAVREQTLGPVHSAVAESLNNLASLYRARGQYAQAEPLY